MSRLGKTTLALAATTLSSSWWLAPAVCAENIPSWNGPYLLTLSANAKSGTSMAATTPEFAHRVSYTFSSNCSTGVCVATVTDAPPPKNEHIPRPIEYTWNGSQWVRETTWQWDCLLPDGSIEYNPAKSITVYTPGPNGILTGVFHTDIVKGACQGNVDMPVTAKPVTGDGQASY